MKKLLIPITLLITLGAGCAPAVNKIEPVTSTPSTTEASVPTSAAITYYVSVQRDRGLKYCNGADMDSAGYKNALTEKISTRVGGNLSTEDKIKKTLSLAAAAEGYPDDNTRVASTTFKNGIVTLYPASGWAGSSIFLCSWRPFAEKQLEQFSEVKKIVFGF